VPAKQLFGAAAGPAPLAARAIGSYAKGCLAGAQPLAVDGPAWQAMRLSRNRNWGHPQLIKLVERLAVEAQDFDGWRGLLVGDISQPRGGPMLTGHASHQIGLDADIWFTPMPDRRLTPREREELSATSMLTPDSLAVNSDVWTPAHVQIVKRAASYREVDRVFVHPAIKKALCETAGDDRRWLSKVRPIWGHYYHFHIRMDCPAGSATCETQAPVPGDDGCGKELTDWYALLTKPAPPPPPAAPVIAAPAKPAPAKPALTMTELPNECRVVLDAGTPKATAQSSPPSQPREPAAATAAGKPQGASRSAQQ
jgi:penicillin-insensitive murein DD-endopeptidase